jgi:DNA-binding NtrC family response regulator
MPNILVVDDEIGIRELLSEILSDEGHVVVAAENAQAARAARARDTPDLVLLDIWMPDTDGVTLLKEWSSAGLLTMPVIMMSGHATIDTAVEATRFGALDFLEKPIALARLLAAVRAGLDRGRMLRNLRASMAAPALAGGPGALTAGAPHEPAAPAVAPANPLLDISLDQPLREARDHFERIYFEYHLERERFSMTRVADRAGLERTHLYRKLKQLGVELARAGRRAPAGAALPHHPAAVDGTEPLPE